MSESLFSSSGWLRRVFLVGSVVAGVLATLWMSHLPGVTREAALMSGIFVLAALLWLTEALPLFATSLLVIGLQIILLANPGNWYGIGFENGPSPSYREILAAAADPILLLFFGGFILAQAAVKEGVDKSISSWLLRPFGHQPKWVLVGVLSITAVFSMFMSNTATTAMMITLVAPMLMQMPKDELFRKGLVLAVPVAANIGGMGTPIGTPPNAVATSFLLKHGHHLDFLQWMLMAVPLVIVVLIIAWGLLLLLFPPTHPDLKVTLTPQPVTRRGWFVVAVFGVTVLLWLTDRLHGLPSAVVALIPAIAFTCTQLLDRKDINSLEWNVLILIGGGISLGAGMQMTGLDKWMAGALPIGPQTSPILVVAILVVGTVFMSTFMSNTAAANLLLPIGVSLATGLGGAFGEVRIALSIAFAASLAMSLPVSTPPNAIAYSKGEFSTKDLVKVGVVIGIVGSVLVLTLGSFLMTLAGLK